MATILGIAPKLEIIVLAGVAIPVAYLSYRALRGAGPIADKVAELPENIAQLPGRLRTALNLATSEGVQLTPEAEARLRQLQADDANARLQEIVVTAERIWTPQRFDP